MWVLSFLIRRFVGWGVGCDEDWKCGGDEAFMSLVCSGKFGSGK